MDFLKFSKKTEIYGGMAEWQCTGFENQNPERDLGVRVPLPPPAIFFNPA